MSQGPWYHGTFASLKAGDLIAPGRESNFTLSHPRRVFFTPVLGWAVFYAVAACEPDDSPHVYEVQPTAVRTFRDPDSRWYGGVGDRRARWSGRPLAVIQEIPITTDLLKRASRLMSLMETAVAELEQAHT